MAAAQAEERSARAVLTEARAEEAAARQAVAAATSPTQTARAEARLERASTAVAEARSALGASQERVREARGAPLAGAAQGGAAAEPEASATPYAWRGEDPAAHRDVARALWLLLAGSAAALAVVYRREWSG